MTAKKVKNKITGLVYKDFRIGWKTLFLVAVALFLILNFSFNINLGFISCGSTPVDIHLNKKLD